MKVQGWSGALATAPRGSRARQLRLRLHGLEQEYIGAWLEWQLERRAYYPTEPPGSSNRWLLIVAARRYRLALYVAGFPALARNIQCPKNM